MDEEFVETRTSHENICIKNEVETVCDITGHEKREQKMNDENFCIKNEVGTVCDITGHEKMNDENLCIKNEVETVCDITGHEKREQNMNEKYLKVKMFDSGEDVSEYVQAYLDNVDSMVIPCILCKIICMGDKNYELHLIGKKHIRKMKQENPDPLLDRDPSQNPYRCIPCEKKFSGIIPYQDHICSKVHEKKMKLHDDLVNLNTCIDCNKSFIGPGNYKQHLESDSHAKHVARISMIEDLKKNYTGVLSVDDEFISCNICNKRFNDPKSVQDHLNGKNHVFNTMRCKLVNNYCERNA